MNLWQVVEWRYDCRGTNEEWRTLERYATYGEAQQRANALNADLDEGDKDYIAYLVYYPEKEDYDGD